MTPGAVIKPVVFDGAEYFVAGRVGVEGLRFWVERPRGQVWLHINETIDQDRHGLDPAREILASTWDDPSAILKRLARESGWFEFTGREVTFPQHQVNEVWRLSRECLDVLRPHSVGSVMKKILLQDAGPSGELPSSEPSIAQLVSRTTGRLKQLGFSALVLLRPEPSRERGVVLRKLAAASAEPLLRSASWLEVGPGSHDLAVFQVDLEAVRSGWSSALSSAGFKTAQVLRVPVSGVHCYEFLALSMSGFVTDASSHAVVYEIMSGWPAWRQAVQREFCPLSAREIEALKAVASGLNGAEASEMLGCVERTFRLHIENAKRKVFAASAAEAAFKAQLLCAF